MTDLIVKTTTRYSFEIEIELPTPVLEISKGDEARGAIWYQSNDTLALLDAKVFLPEVEAKFVTVRKKKKLPKVSFDISYIVYARDGKMHAAFTCTATKRN